MVARRTILRRRRKWRDHCATCGIPIPSASTWAYCSKRCEANVRYPGGDHGEGGMTEQDAERFLDLAEQLERLDPRDPEHERVQAQMREIREVGTVPVRDRITFPNKASTRLEPDWWCETLERDQENLDRACARVVICALRLGEHLGDARTAVGRRPWRRLFADHPERVHRALGCAQRWATELVAAAENEMVAARRVEAPVRQAEHSAYLMVRHEWGRWKQLWPALLERARDWLSRHVRGAEHDRTASQEGTA